MAPLFMSTSTLSTSLCSKDGRTGPYGLPMFAVHFSPVGWKDQPVKSRPR